LPIIKRKNAPAALTGFAIAYVPVHLPMRLHLPMHTRMCMCMNACMHVMASCVPNRAYAYAQAIKHSRTSRRSTSVAGPPPSPPPAGSARAGSPIAAPVAATRRAAAGDSRIVPSTTADVAGARTHSGGAGLPSSCPRASISTDLPDPDSPVMALRPGVNFTVCFETSAKSWIRSS
jgi:hypothetical protein